MFNLPSTGYGLQPYTAYSARPQYAPAAYQSYDGYNPYPTGYSRYGQGQYQSLYSPNFSGYSSNGFYPAQASQFPLSDALLGSIFSGQSVNRLLFPSTSLLQNLFTGSGNAYGNSGSGYSNNTLSEFLAGFLSERFSFPG